MLAFKYFWAVLLLNFANGEHERENLNGLVDSILQSTKESIQAKNKGDLTIPDMEKDWSEKVGFVKIKGHLKATEGVFRNLASVQRTGDATLDLSEDVAKLRMSLGLSELEISFNHCRIWSGRLSMSESLRVSVNSNSIDGQISVFDDGVTCKATLDRIEILKLDGYRVDMHINHAPKFVSKIFNKIGDWVLNHFHDKIKEVAERELHEHVAKEMQKYKICDILK